MKSATSPPQPTTRRKAPRRLAALGWHTLVELHGCEARRLRGVPDVRRAVLQAVRAGGGTIVKAVFHAFSPWGVSGVVVITESHVTIHTWPEYGFAAVDLFTCGPTLDHRVIIEALRAAFRASRTEARRFRRGRNLTQMPTPAGNRDGVPRPARRVVGKKGKRP